MLEGCKGRFGPAEVGGCWRVVGMRVGGRIRSVGSLWRWEFDALHGLGASPGIAIEGFPLARYGFPPRYLRGTLRERDTDRFSSHMCTAAPWPHEFEKDEDVRWKAMATVS
jgi:hypothetical protein